LVKDADEPAVAAMFAGELPGNSHGEAGLAAVVMLARLRRCGRSRVATGPGTSSQSEPGDVGGAGGAGGAQRGDRARIRGWCAGKRAEMAT
jgi:hypothetical protein